MIVSPTIELIGNLSMLGYFVQNIFVSLVFLFLFLGYHLYKGLTLLSLQASTENHKIIRSLGVTKKFVQTVCLLQPSILGFCGTVAAVVGNWIGIALIKSMLEEMLPGHVVDCAAKVDFEVIVLLLSGLGVAIVSTQSTLNGNESKGGSVLAGTSGNQAEEVEVKVERKDRGIPFSTSRLILGIQLATIGFTFYYLAPQAFFKGRMDIFLICLVSVLLLGITCLSLLASAYVQPFVEWAIIKLFTFTRSGRLLTILDGEREVSPIRNGLRAIWSVIGMS